MDFAISDAWLGACPLRPISKILAPRWGAAEVEKIEYDLVYRMGLRSPLAREGLAKEAPTRERLEAENPVKKSPLGKRGPGRGGAVGAREKEKRARKLAPPRTRLF